MGLTTRNAGAYEVDKLCRRALHDLAFREALIADPAAAIAALPLTQPQRDAFLAGDVATLHALGASAFLLSYLPRWAIVGLDLATYNARMRASTESPSR